MGDLREADLQEELAGQVAGDIVCGNRSAARQAIRHHYDPAWFVLEVHAALVEHQGRDPLLAAADLRRLLRY